MLLVANDFKDKSMFPILFDIFSIVPSNLPKIFSTCAHLVPISPPASAKASILSRSSPEIAPISCSLEVISPVLFPDFIASYNLPAHNATSSKFCPVPAATSPITFKWLPVEIASPAKTCSCLLALNISSRENGV